MASGDNPLPQMQLDANGLPIAPSAQRPRWEQPVQTPTAPSNAPIMPPPSAPGVTGGLPPGSAGNLPPASTVTPPDPASDTASSIAPSGFGQSAWGPGGQTVPPPYQGPALRGGPVKNILTRMFYGMGQAAAAHVGLPTDYDIQRTQYQQAIQANDLALKQAGQQLQYQNVTLPNGVTMPLAVAQKVYPAYFSMVGRLGAAQIQTRYQKNALGVFDTWNPTYDEGGNVQPMPGTAMPRVTFSQDDVNRYGINPQFVGQTVPTNRYTEVLNAYHNWATNKTIATGFKENIYGQLVPITTTREQERVAPSAGPAAAPPGPGQFVTPAAPVPSTAAPTPPTIQTSPLAPAARVVPPGTPGGRALAGFIGKNAGNWVTVTEPDTNREVAVPAGDAARMYPNQVPGQMPASEVVAMMNARQAYQNFTKVGDPGNPATWGVMQLIDSLDKGSTDPRTGRVYPGGQLGTFVSRYNAFLTRDLGASPNDDPRIITLLDKNHLGATKTMLGHIGKARAPETIRSFMDLANAGTMNASTLRAGTQALIDYNRDAGFMPSQGPGTAIVPPAQTGPSPAAQDFLNQFAPR